MLNVEVLFMLIFEFLRLVSYVELANHTECFKIAQESFQGSMVKIHWFF